MSVIADRVRQIDAQLNRIPFAGPSDDHLSALNADGSPTQIAAAFESPRVNELLQIARDLSSTSTSEPLLPAWRIEQLLEQSGLAKASVDFGASAALKNPYESEVEWRLVSKATIQTFGLVMETLLEDNIGLEDDLWYWNEVLSSYRFSTIYTVQTSPLRLWALTQEIYTESKQRFQHMKAEGFDGTLGHSRDAINGGWNKFYGIVKETIRDRSLNNLSGKLMTPFAQSQAEAHTKRKQLKKMRQMTASGLGVLMDEGLILGVPDDKMSTASDDGVDWKGPVERSVALIDMVLSHVLSLETNVSEFEDKVFTGVQEDPSLTFYSEDCDASAGPAILAKRLLTILRQGLPGHRLRTQNLVLQNGKPGVLVRWWLPAGIALLSSGAILRVLTNRRAELITWVQDLGSTLKDFYFNWVVEPITKLVRTIRHDEKREFAIMSRDSLKADLESLERMVVDFATDRPQFAHDAREPAASALSAAQIADIQAKVGEGDVTPVLRAYEQNIRHPFSGTVRGDLVRALLIQIQQTKVDLKVALSGIDSLLKSQELVFGFLGLTPGILVTAAILQYVNGLFSNSSGGKQRGNSRKGVMILRNIDRILAEARPTEDGSLLYKEHGLLLCEIHVLRNLVNSTGLLPRGEISECFLQDMDSLANGKVASQKAALERVRWTYGRWFRA
ncbi:hypothetical protein TD95_001239 [Thielaviopsis punctulata]|uniref:Nuclear control of ATPase protein 2 n=1 Tax=Thielaviopsis punctulata TaxID=72032 RepID=A0A0F4ZBK8_9PEZI|nr:hypothetical protein TD95_001239 [Thielaviopsis punctulata]